MYIFRLSTIVVLQLFIFAFAETITVYKSPACGCCEDWVGLLQEAGHTVHIEHPDDLHAIKMSHHLPDQLVSCHTAIINGFVFEGHIPEADIMAFLENPPEGARGLAVPGMPANSPGMARPGQSYKNFDVIAFDEQNQLSLYKKY